MPLWLALTCLAGAAAQQFPPGSSGDPNFPGARTPVPAPVQSPAASPAPTGLSDPSTTTSPSAAPSPPAAGNGARVAASPVDASPVPPNCASHLAALAMDDEAAPSGPTAGAVIDLQRFDSVLWVPASAEEKDGYYKVALCGAIDHYSCKHSPCTDPTQLTQDAEFGKFSGVGPAVLEDDDQVAMITLSNISFAGGSANSCGKHAGSLVTVHCNTPAPTDCACQQDTCVCSPSIESCDGEFGGRPNFQVYIDGCDQGSVARHGFNIGTSTGLRDVVKDGWFVGHQLGNIPAEMTNVSFYLWLEDGSRPMYYQEPAMNATDFLGKVKLSFEGSAVAGGLLTSAAPVKLAVEFACEGAESVSTVHINVAIPPYLPVDFSFSKLCPFTKGPAQPPVDVIARVSSVATGTFGLAVLLITWVPTDQSDAVTGYELRASLADGAAFPDRVFKVRSRRRQADPGCCSWISCTRPGPN